MTFKEQIQEIIERNRALAQQQGDQDWLEWLEDPDSIIDVLVCPELGIMPSQRRSEDIIAIIKYKTKKHGRS